MGGWGAPARAWPAQLSPASPRQEQARWRPARRSSSSRAGAVQGASSKRGWVSIAIWQHLWGGRQRAGRRLGHRRLRRTGGLQGRHARANSALKQSGPSSGSPTNARISFSARRIRPLHLSDWPTGVVRKLTAPRQTRDLRVRAAGAWRLRAALPPRHPAIDPTRQPIPEYSAVTARPARTHADSTPYKATQPVDSNIASNQHNINPPGCKGLTSQPSCAARANLRPLQPISNPPRWTHTVSGVATRLQNGHCSPTRQQRAGNVAGRPRRVRVPAPAGSDRCQRLAQAL